MTTPLRRIAQALLQAQRIVIFSGAGMSADSGIATFRNDPESYWSKFDWRELASPKGWSANRQRVWGWYEARRAKVMATSPNPGHIAIAQLAGVLNARTGRSVQVDVVTQNVDNLHERAGSTDVIHLHGSLFAPRCTQCHRPGQFSPNDPDISAVEVEPPLCEHCGGYIRPGVVWFGESMPQAEFQRAKSLVNMCDAMLVVGTSGVVYPAAELPIIASQLKKFTAEINPLRTEISDCMRVQWRTTAAQGFPELLELLGVDGAIG